MTVSTQLNWVSFTGAVTPQTVFPLPFKFYDVDTIFARLNGIDLVQGVDFSVGGIGETLSGTVTLAIALAQDSVLYVERTVPYLQEVDLQGQGSFLPETHEDALDILEFQIQQLVAKFAIAEVIAAALIYDLVLYANDASSSSAVLARWAIARGVIFPPNFAGSKVNAGVAATAGTVLTVKRNGVQVGTLTFAGGGTVPTMACPQWTVAPGNIVTIEAPVSPDPTLAAIAITLIGVRIP